MPNINLSEKDMSTFADQQFIQVMYNGNTNSLPKSGSTNLDFTVKFMVDETIYQIIYVGENQKVSAPINVPVKEGYEFKNWLLNGEAFDFSTVITSDILLIAEFEEAPAPSAIYENTLSFSKQGDTATAAVDSNTTLDSLGLVDGQNYTLTVGENSYQVVGFDDEGVVLINPDLETAGLKWSVGAEYGTGNLIVNIISGTIFDDGDYLVTITESEAPASSETTIIPTSAYETEDTGYGDGYLEFTAIEPAVIDDSVLGEYINEVDAAVEGGTLENIKHTINVDNTTLTDQVLKSDSRLGITYFGNVSLYDETGEDTGEEWFLGVSSTLAFTTKTPTTINFGLSYKIVQ